VKPYYEAGPATLFHGDCIEVMRELPDASVHAVVTDPPYGISFMGKQWDQPGQFGSTSRRGGGPNLRRGDANAALEAGRYDLSPAAMVNFQRWCEAWAAECLRLLKPGGHLLSFGGSRTWHRLAAGIEDAGFEIRDSVAWIYAQGFPKSLDVSKAIEKVERGDLVRAKLIHFAEERGVNGRWLEDRGIASAASFGDWTVGGHVPSDRNWEIVKTALEVTPEEEAAFEREVLAAARPRVADGTVYGLGHSGKRVGAAVTDAAKDWSGWGTALKPSFEPIVVARKPLAGTVAANVLAHGTGALNIDATRIMLDSAVNLDERQRQHTETVGMKRLGGGGFSADHEQAKYDARGRWPSNVVLDESQATELDRQSGTLTSGVLAAHHARAPKEAGILGAYGSAEGERGYGDSAGASRFFPTFRYEAKAPSSERPKIGDVQHPTVKPLDLMRWLCRLVTPPDGVILEPFAGSGTTLEAALAEGFHVIGIERETDYLPLIMSRLSKPIEQALFGEGGAA